MGRLYTLILRILDYLNLQKTYYHRILQSFLCCILRYFLRLHHLHCFHNHYLRNCYYHCYRNHLQSHSYFGHNFLGFEIGCNPGHHHHCWHRNFGWHHSSDNFQCLEVVDYIDCMQQLHQSGVDRKYPELLVEAGCTDCTPAADKQRIL